MNNIKFPAAAMLLAAFVCLPSCHKSHKADSESDAPLPVDVETVQVAPVLLTKTYPGSISSQNKVDIVARVNGTLTAQLFNSGDYVKKGQVLFTIEDTQYRDAVTQARATLRNAQSAYEYAQRNYAALSKALESDAVSQIQVLQAKSTMEQDEAAIRNAEAALRTAETNLGYCTIRAPFDGQMAAGAPTPGSYVAGAGSPVKLTTIYDNKTFFADFYIDDKTYEQSVSNSQDRADINYDNVEITFSDSLPHTYSGKLTYMDPSVNVGTGTLMARLSVDNPYGELKSGMYCTISLPYSYLPDAVLVRDASISTSQTNKYLYLVNDSNKVVYCPITVGDLANDSMRIVTDGVTGGERYVSKALLKVRPGMAVKPIEK